VIMGICALQTAGLIMIQNVATPMII